MPDSAAPSRPTTRRDFLRTGALAAAAAGTLAAYKDGGAASTPPAGTAESADGNRTAANAARPGAAAHDSDHSGGSTAPNPSAPAAPPPNTAAAYGGLTVAQARAKAGAMDAMHERGMKAFPAKTRGRGNQPLKPRVENGVKVFELTARPLKWETEPGKFVDAWAYNEQVPGPQLRVTEGDRVRVVLKNELPESTCLHFHGVVVPIDQDGVLCITQPTLKPGETFTYDFVA